MGKNTKQQKNPKQQKKAEIHVMDDNNGQGGLAGMDDAILAQTGKQMCVHIYKMISWRWFTINLHNRALLR